MRTTTKIITSTLTILLLVGLIPLGSITVNAVDYTAWKYIIVIDDINVYVSDVPILLYSKRSFLYIGCQYSSTVTPTILQLLYLDDINDWVAETVSLSTDTGVTTVGSGSTSTTNIYKISEGNGKHIQYNDTWYDEAISSVASFTNTLSLPEGLTETRVNELIDIKINSTTNIATNANTLQQQAINNYQQYIEGTITLNQLTVNLNNIVNQLNTLNQQPDATLADKVAINNALTNTQIINDSANKDAIIEEMEEDLTTTSNITSSIATQVSNANTTFQNFSQGSVTQSEAVTQINQYITNLTQLITPQTPTADVEAINTAVNTITSIKHSITNYSDLDKDTSESAIQSDQEELDYLDELTGETLGTIQDISPEKEFSEQQKTEGTNILSVIWNNDLIKKLIPICACFMVVCVVLGIRYKV